VGNSDAHYVETIRFGEFLRRENVENYFPLITFQGQQEDIVKRTGSFTYYGNAYYPKSQVAVTGHRLFN
jgi:hypothetical protein